MIIDHPTVRDRALDLDSLMSDFLTDLQASNRSPQTRRAYAADLRRFASFYRGPVEGITPEVLRAFFATRAHLKPASRARTQAAVASFCTWAYRQELISTLPMARVERVKPDAPTARGLTRTQVETILAVIPASQARDRLLFRLLFETGVRIGEALSVYVEDLDLTPDDEHLA